MRAFDYSYFLFCFTDELEDQYADEHIFVIGAALRARFVRVKLV